MMLKLKLQYLATSCKELTHWKRLWCWEGLRAGGEGDDRGWDGWMASLTQWTWVWENSGSLWWTGRPGVLQFMGSQRVRHDWATELNWTEDSQYQVFQYWDSLKQVTYYHSLTWWGILDNMLNLPVLQFNNGFKNYILWIAYVLIKTIGY